MSVATEERSGLDPAIVAEKVNGADGDKRIAESQRDPDVPPTVATVPVVVLGDIHVDEILIEVPFGWRKKATIDAAGKQAGKCRRARQSYLRIHRLGGAWLIDEMLKAHQPPIVTSHSYCRSEAAAVDTSLAYPVSLCRMAAFPVSSEPSAAKEKVYRVKEFLGWQWHSLRDKSPPIGSNGRAYDQPVEVMDPYKKVKPPIWELKCGCGTCTKPPEPQIVVVADLNNGYRRRNDPLLTEYLSTPGAGDVPDAWCVWQYANPSVDATGKLESALANTIAEHCADRSIVVVKSEHLRNKGANISQEGSTERLIEDIARERERSKVLKQLLTYRYVVIWMHESVVLLDRDHPTEITIWSCPNAIDELNNLEHGVVGGGMAIVTAAVTLGLADSFREKKFDDAGILAGLKRGIGLGTVLHAHHYWQGYAPASFIKDSVEELLDWRPFTELFANPVKFNVDGKLNFHKSYAHQRKYTTRPEFRLNELTFKSKFRRGKLSRIKAFAKLRPPADRKAVQIVREGFRSVFEESAKYENYGEINAIKTPTQRWFPESEILCPYPKFGKLYTVHRKEIDQCMSVYTLILNYMQNPRIKVPLSLATFGQPGTGKTFAVKEIVSTVDPDAAKNALEFNIAQFRSAKELATAFHHVRDIAGSATPLVTFDEFDCTIDGKERGWLKNLLSPMNDGKYRDGDNEYNIGRAIFLFTGGTAHTFKEFCRGIDGQVARDAKLPDFVSRLRGYLDILSVNSAKKKKPVNVDLTFRRAVLLRGLIERYAGWIIDPATDEADIDPEIVYAFLKVRRYEHGNRSMQAIIEMASTGKSQRFREASLSADEQLSMHVNATQFCEQIRHWLERIDP